MRREFLLLMLLLLPLATGITIEANPQGGAVQLQVYDDGRLILNPDVQATVQGQLVPVVRNQQMVQLQSADSPIQLQVSVGKKQSTLYLLPGETPRIAEFTVQAPERAEPGQSINIQSSLTIENTEVLNPPIQLFLNGQRIDTTITSSTASANIQALPGTHNITARADFAGETLEQQTQLRVRRPQINIRLGSSSIAQDQQTRITSATIQLEETPIASAQIQAQAIYDNGSTEQLDIENLYNGTVTLQTPNRQATLIIQAGIGEYSSQRIFTLSPITVMEQPVEAETIEPVTVGKPVRWRTQVPATQQHIEVHKNARNIQAQAMQGNLREVLRIQEPQILSATSTQSQTKQIQIASTGMQNADTVIIEYETEAPRLIQQNTTPYKHDITITSETHYVNITSIMNITPVQEEHITLVRTTQGIREKTQWQGIDANNDGLIEAIQWIVPHLSNQTYELSINIINPIEFPQVNETWTVLFETQGQGELRITSPNASWEELPENTTVLDEMLFESFTCGAQSVTNELLIETQEGNIVNYTEATGVKPVAWIVPEWECNQTARFANKMYIPGYAVLNFTFENAQMSVTQFAFDPPLGIAPTYNNWEMSVSNASIVLRNESFWISANWSSGSGIALTRLEHNGTGTFANYSQWETARAEVGQAFVNGWTTINYTESFSDPVVVVQPKHNDTPTMDEELATPLITNVTSTSFAVRMIDDDAITVATNVSYIIVERGAQTASDGMLIQADTITINNYDASGENAAAWNSIVFPTSYATPPSIIGGPGTALLSDWLAVRFLESTLSATGVSLSLERTESAGSAPIAAAPQNELNWIAINRTSGLRAEGRYSSNVGEDPGSTNWLTQTFSNTYSLPAFFGIVGDSGSDPAVVGSRLLNGSQVDIRTTEERTGDSEQNHADVDLAWAIFEQGLGIGASTQRIANHSLNLADGTQFPRVGPLQFRTMHAITSDTDENQTEPPLEIILYSHANATLIQTDPLEPGQNDPAQIQCQIIDAWTGLPIAGYPVNFSDNVTGNLGSNTTDSSGFARIWTTYSTLQNVTAQCSIGNFTSGYYYAHPDANTINTSYEVRPSSTLIVFDQEDAPLFTPAYTYQQTSFYANYTNSTGPITTATCSIEFDTDWWNTDWDRRIELFLDTTDVSSDVTDIPIAVILNTSTIDYIRTNSDGSDVRILDENQTTLLDYEIEVWNQTGQSVLWVEMPEIRAGSASQKLYLYYNNSDAIGVADKSGVWDASHAIVYHMNASGDDSSLYNRDVVSASGTQTRTGTLGYMQEFDGTDSWDQTNLAWWEDTFSVRSHEMVFTTGPDTNTRQVLFAEGGGTNGVMMYVFQDRLWARWWSEGSGWNGNNINVSINANTTYHAAMTFANPGNYSLYLDGDLVDSRATPTALDAHPGDGAIGNTNTAKDFHDTSSSGHTFQGNISSFIGHDSIRSPSWWKLSAKSSLGTLILPNDLSGGTMTYNATSQLYEYNVSFIESETARYTVTCESPVFSDRQEEGNVTILEAPISFSNTNGTIIDRDEQQAEQDSIALNISIPGVPNGLLVTFYANNTNPALGTIPLLLGQNTTTSQNAQITWNPDNLTYAGNYTIFATAPQARTYSPIHALVYQTPQTLFTSTNETPKSNYTIPENITVQVNISSRGPENDFALENAYELLVNASFASVFANVSAELSRISNIWNLTTNATTLGGVGEWNVSVNITGNFTFPTAISRNLTLFSEVNITNITLSDNPITNTTTLDVVCEVQDVNTGAGIGGVNTTLRRNSTSLGWAITNSSGQAQFNFTTAIPGNYEVVCELGNSSESFFTNSTPARANASLIVTAPNNLTVVDDQDLNGYIVYAGHPVSLEANWTTLSGAAIPSGTCVANGPNNATTPLTYDAGRELWLGDLQLYVEGIAEYEVVCNSGIFGESRASNNVTVQSVVNLTAHVEITSITSTLHNTNITIFNHQNYTERNITVLLMLPEQVVYNSSPTPINSTQIQGMYAGTLVEWHLTNITATNTSIISLNTSTNMSVWQPLLTGLSSPTFANITVTEAG